MSASTQPNTNELLPLPEPGGAFGLPPQEQWDEWRARYGVRPPALRQSPVPEILVRAVKEFNELAAIRRALLDNELKLNREHAELVARNERKQARYRDRLRQATIHGTEFPAKPDLEEWPGTAYDKSLFDEYHEVLESVERALLREGADEWEKVIQEHFRPFAKAVAIANQALAEAEAAAQPYRSALEAVRKSVSAVDAIDSSRLVSPDGGERRAKEQILADFNESRVQPRRRGGAR
jgi:hypothetical protein